MKLKLQYFGHLKQRVDLLEKTLMLERMRLLDGITESMDMSLSKLREIVKDRKGWRVAVYEVTNSWT